MVAWLSWVSETENSTWQSHDLLHILQHEKVGTKCVMIASGNLLNMPLYWKLFRYSFIKASILKLHQLEIKYDSHFQHKEKWSPSWNACFRMYWTWLYQFHIPESHCRSGKTPGRPHGQSIVPFRTWTQNCGQEINTCIFQYSNTQAFESYTAKTYRSQSTLIIF